MAVALPRASRAALPGLAAAAAVALLAQLASTWAGTALFHLGKSPISPVMLAVLAGIAIRSGIGVAPALESGIAVAASALLRAGIALLGLRLTLAGIGTLGMRALPIVAGCLAVAWLLVPRVLRAFGLRGALVTLLTAGTSICGCTAILAISPAIRARAEETGYAVTVVVIVGLAGMLLYPALAHHLLGGDATAAGIFLGAAIHDTSQVIGAALLYSGHYLAPAALDAATVTKLLRNLTLLAAVPLLAALHARAATGGPASAGRVPVPGFVLAFVAFAALRSLGDSLAGTQAGLPGALWASGVQYASATSELLLTVGMAAVGLTVELGQMRRVGWRPLAAGAVSAALVGATGLALVLTLA